LRRDESHHCILVPVVDPPRGVYPGVGHPCSPAWRVSVRDGAEDLLYPSKRATESSVQIPAVPTAAMIRPDLPPPQQTVPISHVLILSSLDIFIFSMNSLYVRLGVQNPMYLCVRVAPASVFALHTSTGDVADSASFLSVGINPMDLCEMAYITDHRATEGSWV